MGCLSRTNLIMIHSFLKFLINADFACCLNGEMGQSVHHCSGSAMWRLDSSLRSHRAWRSQCRHAYSGLDKSLFASVGPNSRWRGHLQSTILVVINYLQAKKDISSQSRMKPSRGHRLDGTFVSRYFSLVSAKLTNAANIPPYIVSVRSCSLLLFSFLSSCFVGVFKMIRRFCAFVKRAVSHHGVYNSQQSSAHGDIGLGLSDSFDQPLPNSFLFGIRAAKGNGSLAQCPSESSRTGFCDPSGLSSSGGFFVVGSYSCPELQSIGIGESIEWSYLSGNDACPDVCDTWYAFEDSCHSGEFFTPVSLNNFSSERFSLTLNERNDINEVRESFPLDVFEKVSVGEEPLLSGGSFKLRSANISGLEYRLHAVLGPAERFTELFPVSAKFSQLHQRFISDITEGAVSLDESDGNIERVVPVVFSAFTSSVSQFGSIGYINSFNAVLVSVNEPFDKTNSFDSHPSGLWQGVDPVFDLVDTFSVDGQRADDAFVGVYSSERDSGFVQIDSDERSEVDADYVSAFSDSFTLFCLNVFHNEFLKRG